MSELDDEDTIDTGDTDDRTVVVDRDGDRTAVIDRGDPDKTVVVQRRAATAPTAEREPEPEPELRVLPTPAVETYAPRPIAPASPPGPAVPRGDEPARGGGPSLPSVARGSRRAGVAALLAFAVACAVSVVGAVAVVVWFARS